VKRLRRRKPSLGARLKAGSLVLAVLAALAAYGGYRLAEWPGFRLSRVVVSGNVRVPSEQIVAAAAVPDDRNLWFVRLAAAQRRVAAIPWIATARLVRVPPSTLRIEVTERTPVATVPAGAAEGTPGYALVDATGRVLERDERPRWRQPLVLGASRTSGDFPRIVADLKTLADAGVRVRELDVTPLGELVAVTYSKLRLDFGDDADLTRKASLVNPIIARLGRRVSGVAALDLRAPRTPVVVYR